MLLEIHHLDELTFNGQGFPGWSLGLCGIQWRLNHQKQTSFGRDPVSRPIVFVLACRLTKWLVYLQRLEGAVTDGG